MTHRPAEKRTTDCKRLIKRTENQQHYVQNGIIEISLDIPLEAPNCEKSPHLVKSCLIHTVNFKASYRDTKKEIVVKKIDKDENENILIIKDDKKWKLNEPVVLDIISTHPMTELNYQIFARDNVAASETVQVPNTQKTQLKITPTPSMVPKAKIAVFYRSNGKIVSDAADLDFESELGNPVNIKLSENVLKPGENISIEVSANPNSFIGVLGVDQSVLLLGNDNDLQETAVFDEFKKYDKVDKNNWNYKYNYEYVSSAFKDFSYGEKMFFITNANTAAYNYDSSRFVQYEHDIEKIQYEYTGGFYPWNGGFGGFPGLSGNPGFAYAMSPSFGGGGFGGGFSGSAANAGASSQSFGSTSGFGGLSNSFAPNDNAPSPSFSFGPITSKRPTPTTLKPDKKTSEPPTKPIEIRKEFPETWLFESFDLQNNESSVSITKKVPDTITSWILTGFAVDHATGLGLTRTPSKFRVFQSFFVTTNLPYSIKRGEVVSIPILIFNYLDSDQEVDVTFFNSAGEFEFTEVNDTQAQLDVRVGRNRRQLEDKRTKSVFLKSEEGRMIPFMIKPLKVGSIKIKVTASSLMAGDGLEKLLIVEPEGVTRYMNEAKFVELQNKNETESRVKIEVPQNAVPDSTKIEASVIGDVMGPSIENLDHLIKLPYGCGEQNMLNFVPNIVALDYLTSVDKLTPEIKKKAISHMESGYQRELGYKHPDGSYSAFGKSDNAGNTWLTAFVAKSFNQAKRYIEIDEKIIDKALEYLANVQADDGHFQEKGRLLDKKMQGGASNGVALTAYTLTAFLENEDGMKKYQNVIEKAMNYLKTNSESSKDNYSLAIITYAMQLSKDQISESFMNKLKLRATEKDGMKFWVKEIPESDRQNPWNHRPNSVNVEMSAYALQAYMHSENVVDALPIMRWLITQQNEKGGFQSTQDTVVGLQALAKIASKIYSPDANFAVEITPDSGNPVKLSVDSSNALILQKTKLPSEAKEFNVVAKGRGFGIFQISYQYNIDLNGEWPRFNLEPKVHENSNKNFLHLVACTNYISDETSNVSNMAVMEVELPSGFTFDSDSKDELKSIQNVKKIELENSDTKVVIYFDNIGTEKICPEIKAYREHSVAKQKRVSVKVYDYYDNSQKATTFYDPPEISLCDICDGAEECKADCEVPEVNLVD